MQTGIAASDLQEKTPAPFRSVFALAFLAGAAVGAASLVNFLRYHDYPLFRSEVAILLAGLLALNVLAGWVYASSGRPGRAILEGLLVFLALDINGLPVWMAIIAGMAVAAAGYARRMTLLPVLGLFSAVVLLTTLVGLGERRPSLERIPGDAKAGTSAPAILHLILDEHIGPEGLTDPALRAELERFYTTRDFRLFTRAYSEHFHTLNAIPAILNFGDAGALDRSEMQLQNRPAGYFSVLARRGYAFNIYQSEYIDYCSNSSFASCTEYVGFSLSSAKDLPLSSIDKARLAASKFAVLSEGVVAFSDAYDRLVVETGLARRGVPLLRLEHRSRSGAISALAALDVLTADLGQASPGNVYFAHLLIPHYPFVARPDCTILPLSDWELRRSRSSIDMRRNAYHSQLRCVLRRIDAALAALAASPAGASSIVVIHGDHGSRITRVEPRSDRAERMSPEDLVAGYSTLFAVRAPGLESGLDPRPASAAELLQSLVRSGFTSAETARRPGRARTVMLGDRDLVPTLAVPLPADWQDSR